MRIACPSCHAEYEVPDAMLAGGARQLRCARCGHGFLGALPAAAPAVSPMSAPPLAGPTVAAEPEPGKPAPAPPSDPPPTDPPARAPLADAPSAMDSVPVPAPPEPVPALVTAPDRPPPTRGPMQHSPIDAPQDPPPPATGRLAAAWLGSLALVGAGVAALVVFHAEIAAAWPPAARLYAALGLG